MHESFQNNIYMEAFTTEMRFDLGLNNGRIYIRADLPYKIQEVQFNLNFR